MRLWSGFSDTWPLAGWLKPVRTPPAWTAGRVMLAGLSGATVTLTSGIAFGKGGSPSGSNTNGLNW